MLFTAGPAPGRWCCEPAIRCARAPLPQRLVLHGFGAQLGLGPVPLQQLAQSLALELARLEPGQGSLPIGPGHLAPSMQPAAARGAELPKRRRVLRARFKRLLEPAQVPRQAWGSGLKHGQFAHGFPPVGVFNG
uniref:Uncharacterized protein n=1 Tax=Polaromonas sp. H6N TaxID=1840293 RepID=A0A2S1FJ47_9BURK|nr:hypothetical protein pH6NP1_p006 [Polaromonas sp. H6N]